MSENYIYLLSKNVLVVQNIGCEHLGNLSRLFESDGYNISLLNSQKDLIPTDINSYSGIIILGGPMSVYDNYDYLKDQQKLIKKAVDMQIPTLGICLGSQLIAESLGGTVYPGNLKEIGWYNIEVTENGSRDIFNGVKSFKNKVFQWHGDTFNLPKDSIIFAKSRDYFQAFRIKSAIGIQFHVEVDVNMINDWINQYSKEIEDSKIPVDSIMCKDSQIEELSNLCKLVYVNFRNLIEKTRIH